MVDNPKLYATSPGAMSEKNCPMCSLVKTSKFESVLQKIDGAECCQNYFSCPNCGVVYLSPNNYLPVDAEKARYAQHNNDLQQEGYRRHLNRLWHPLRAHLSPKLSGLDFGSGPSPALATVMQDDGYQVQTWDPYFSPNSEVLSRQYNFITCLEVIEHCSQPLKELKKMASILKPNGLLAIGTLQLDDDAKFLKWGYRMDPTHIIFFRPQTLSWCAKELGMELIYRTGHVFILRKS